jgi:hypothetical protein
MPRLTAAVRGATAAPSLGPAPAVDAAIQEAVPEPQHSSEARLYRHADGRLSPTRPPPDPYTVAARRGWNDLVTYARVNGGCSDCAQGKCVRHGTGVTYAAMCEYLGQLGIPAEYDVYGWHGYDPSEENPLEDPAHPLCTTS